MSEHKERVARPSLLLLGSEPARATLELSRYLFSWPHPSRPATGEPLVIFPGLGAGRFSVSLLVRHCRRLGYDAFDWGQRINTGPPGDFESWFQELSDLLRVRLQRYTRPVTLIGWSLGGLCAREVAKLMASEVRQVITLGTPFNADTDHTHAGWLYRLLNGRRLHVSAALSERLRTPPPVRTTSLYSRTDGVVAWQTCRHVEEGALVKDVEVQSSHLGMGWNPQVLRAITQALIGGDRVPSEWATVSRIPQRDV